jgi:hypothetical protein
MSDELNKKVLNEILRQKLGDSEKIEEKAMWLRQPPSSLTSQNDTTSNNTTTGTENQNGTNDNKKDTK